MVGLVSGVGCCCCFMFVWWGLVGWGFVLIVIRILVFIMSLWVFFCFWF